MKPAWDKLVEEFKDSEVALVADVDCTAEGKELCSKQGVRGYPTIRYGDPDDLQDYKGGRDFDALKTFAQENLGARCGPTNVNLCDEQTQTLLNKFLGMDTTALQAELTNADAKIEKAKVSLAKTFSVSITKKDGESLGLAIEPDDKTYKINEVRAGAVNAFNADNPGQALQANDRITAVNSAEGDLDKMKEGFAKNPVALVIKRDAPAADLAELAKESGIKLIKQVLTLKARQNKEL